MAVDLKRYQITEAGPLQQVIFAEGNSAMFCLHIFKAGFHLPLEPFFCELLEAYNLSPNQLKPNSWAILLTYFLVCKENGWRPSIRVVKRGKLYFYYLQSR